jgi:2-methylcitrate dehydratase PrpD
METSFKFHASCRHTHPAADALLSLIEASDLQPREIESITAHVHQGALDVLGPVTNPRTVHQAKFSMPATLGLIASHRRAGMKEFDAFYDDVLARSFLDRVEMRLDPEIDAAYPARWIGKVSVVTADGRRLQGRVDEPRGDPGNTLSRPEIDAKARSLARYGDAIDAEEADSLLRRLWSISGVTAIARLLPTRQGR